jgi:hypothetical protein
VLPTEFTYKKRDSKMKILGTTKKTALALFLLVLSVTSLLSAKANADTLTITLVSPVQTAAPGATLSFFATVLAPSTNAGTLFLNVADYTTNGGMALDPTPFFENYPFTLDPGASASGLLFTLTVPADEAVGIYLGSFRILGGSTGFSGENLGGANFEVDVPASAVPEPGSILLLMTGLPGVAVLVRSKRHLFTGQNG